MKSHKYWSLGALATMIGTIYTGYKNMKSAHKYFAFSSLLCMIMAIYSGHKIQEKERLCFSRIRRIIEIIDVFTHTYYMALQNDFIPQGLHNQPVSFLL
jgi:hypothetical protein